VYLYNDIVDDHNKFCELSKLELLKTVKQPEFFSVQYPTSQSAAEQKKVPPVTPAIIPVAQQAVDNAKPDTGVSGQTMVVHDTVYIEKRDTIYVANEGEDFHSMEGYAVNNMVLLLDVSGSMNAADKLPLLKKSVIDLLSMMRKEDQVSIVVYSGKAKVLLQPVSFKEEEKIKNAINDLKSSGKTDGNAGIKLAYQVADKNYLRGGNNRIILATDGEFPVSEEASALVEKFSKEDIFLTVFNFGKGSGSSKSLEHLSTIGHGNYEHINRDNMENKLIHEVKAKKAK
jgi:Mg-chelatase subunit ChlD